MRKAAMLAAFVLAATACGPAPGGGSGGGGLTTDESYYPLALGNRWEYRITDGGRILEKVRTVTGQQEISPGVNVWVLESEEGAERVVAWNDYLPGTGVRRFRDEVYDLVSGTLVERTEYDPFTLRFPPFQIGAGMVETYVQREYDASGSLIEEKEKVHQWEVISEDEVITVPAGTFHTMHVRRLNADGSKTREYWMARGVGKVKELGDFVEELTDWHIAK